MALLKLYRGAVAPTSPVQGMIWFNNVTETVEGVEQVKNVIKVYTGTKWEVYGITDADLKALAARVATLEGDVKKINEVTLPALEVALKKYADDAVAAEAKLARAAEEALDGRLDVIEGEGEGSIKKAVADAKAELIDDATENGNTLGKLEGLINDVAADAKSYSIAKVTEGLGENVKEAFKLVDEDGTQVGETINIYKDSSLISVDLVDEKPAETEGAEATKGQFIKYTYVLANGTESVQYVDVSRLLVEAEFKNGLEVSAAGEVSVKVDATSETFLTVGKDGVKLAGVQAAIDAAEAAAKKYTDDSIAALDAEVTSTDGAKVTVKVTEVDGKITAVNVTESDIASAKALATLDAEVQEHEQVVSAALNDLNARIEGHDDRIEALEAGLGAVEHNTVSDGDTTDFVEVSETTDGSHKNYAVSATVVKSANGGDAGLATDAYVREQIAAAAMVWEEGSF